MRAQFPLLICAVAPILGCASSSPTGMPLAHDGAGSDIIGTRPIITGGVEGSVGGIVPIGAYTLTLKDGIASLEPALRQSSLLGPKFELDVTAAFNGVGFLSCVDCFRVTSVAPGPDGTIAVGFSLKHPLPAPDASQPAGSIFNRNDLAVNNVRLVALVDGSTRLMAASGPDSIVLNPAVVTNADGYTRVAPVIDLAPSLTANVFPFITMGDGDSANNGTGNFQPFAGDGGGWEDVRSGDPELTGNYPKGYNVLAQGGSVEDTLEIDGSLADFSTTLVLLASYFAASPGKTARHLAQYYMPEGAIQQSPHVTAVVGTVPEAVVDSPGDILISVVDYQQSGSVTADVPAAIAARDYTALFSGGRIDSSSLRYGEWIGGVNNFLDDADQPDVLGSADIYTAPGNGSYVTPKLLSSGFLNRRGLAGTFYGCVAITDMRDGRPILDLVAAGADPSNPNVFDSMSGLKSDLSLGNPASLVATEPLITYQVFEFTIGGAPTGTVTVIPDTPGRANPNLGNDFYRNGIATSGSDIYVVFNWEGNDDSGLFVVRSADGGASWGAPVQVVGDAVASTDFEGLGFSIMADGGTLALVGIDSDEDVVCLIGANSGTNSTTWPTGPNNRVEVTPQGTGRNFTVSADFQTGGNLLIASNHRETVPATENQVTLKEVTGVGTGPLVASAIGTGIVDNGPDGASSRFDVDLVSDRGPNAYIMWKDNGSNTLEYRHLNVGPDTLDPVENAVPGRTFMGVIMKPNITFHPTTKEPYITFSAPGQNAVGDGEAVDRDVWITARIGGTWGTPVLVNEDDGDLNEQESDLIFFTDGVATTMLAVVYEASDPAGLRSIKLATSDPTPQTGQFVIESLTPAPTGLIDRLDPRVTFRSGGVVVVWEAKREGPAGQGLVRMF